MKKNFVLRSLLAIMLLFVGLNTAWAEEATFNFKNLYGSSTLSSVESKTVDGITISYAKNSAQNAPAFNKDGTLRLYNAANGSGCSATFTTDGSIKITEVVITASSTSYTPTVKYSVDGGSAQSGTWSSTTMTISGIEASESITIQNANTSTKQLRIKEIIITYETAGEGGGDEVTVAQPTFNPAAGAVTKGTEVELSCETADATIYYALGESDVFVEYNEAITINVATTIKAYAKLGDAQSDTVSTTYTIAKLAVPTFTPQGGMVAAGTEVTISATEGATIHYAIGEGAFVEYDGTAIVINVATTITAYATKEGYDNSDEVTAEYTMLPEGTSVGTIVFKTSSSDSSTAANTTNFVTGQVVSTDFTDLSCTATNNCYTGKSGLKMSSGSTNGSFSLDLGKTLNVTQIVVNAVRYGSDAAAMSVNGSGSQSLTATAADYTFDINKEISTIKVDMTKRGYIASITVNYVTASTPDPEEVAVPTFNPAAGPVTKGTQVELSCETVDATIYYALGESDDFVEYNEAITINEATTIKAYAKLGDAQSDTVSTTYTIAKLAVPTFTPQGGMVAAGTEVTISHADDGATIHYAIGEANFIYDGTAIVINEATTITAYATKEGYDNSDEVTAEYTMLPEGTSVGTIDFSTADQRVSQNTEVQVWSNEGITFINNKTSESSNVVDNVNPVRLYKNSEIVIECANGNIAQIVFACNSEDYATALKDAIGDAALVSGSEVTVTLNGTSNSFSAILTSAQVRLNSLTVTYVANPEPEVYPENIVCEQNYYLDVEGSDWTIAEGNSLAACFVNKNTDATTWSVGEYLADTKHYVFYLSQYNVPAAAPARAKAEEAPVYTHVKFVNFKGATDALTPWVDGTRVKETAELTYTPAEGYNYTIYSVAGGAWVGKNDGISTGLEAVEADGMVYAGNVVAAEGAIEVYNLSGAVVARGNNRVDLNGLAGGVYVVCCGNDVLKVVR